jgi:hypothetical protein
MNEFLLLAVIMIYVAIRYSPTPMGFDQGRDEIACGSNDLVDQIE